MKSCTPPSSVPAQHQHRLPSLSGALLLMPPQLPLAYKAPGAVTSTAKLLTSYANASEAERLQPTRRMQRVAMLSAALQPSQYARLSGASGPRNQPGGCCIQYRRSICFVSCATWGSKCIHWNTGCCSWRLALSNLPPHVRLEQRCAASTFENSVYMCVAIVGV